MPSPFPGMDPFIESQEWSDFHVRAIGVIAELLNPFLGGRYVARIQRRVYVERELSDGSRHRARQIEPDVAVFRESSAGQGVLVTAEAPAGTSVECFLPQAEKRREAYLVIRDLKGRPRSGPSDVVTVVELLSPSNKRRRSEGRRSYLRKRREILDGEAHLVEIDLLRGGARMPFDTRSPVALDYLALVGRSDDRPAAHLYYWQLPQRLPVIPIPLAGEDPDVPLDLQAVFETAYDRASYGASLNYSAALKPPADPETARWIDQTLAAQGIPRPATPRTEPSPAEPS